MRSFKVQKNHQGIPPIHKQWLDQQVLYLSSNSPKNVHATSETIPNIKDPIAKINFPKKRITIPVVMRVKETIK